MHSAVSQAETCSEFKPCTVHKVEVSFTRCHCSAATGFQSGDYRMDTVAPICKDGPNNHAHLVLKRGVVLSRVYLHGKARCVCVAVGVCVCVYECVCVMCVCVGGGGGSGGCQCVCDVCVCVGGGVNVCDVCVGGGGVRGVSMCVCAGGWGQGGV